MPYVLPLVDGPLYGTPLALALVEPKLEEHGIEHRGRHRSRSSRGDVVTVGPFKIEFIRVTHSMPDCVAVVVRTPQGVLIHTGDFKIDQTPLGGEPFDLHRFAQLGAEGVLAMFGDSTNIDRRGYTGSELDVEDAFEEIFTSTRGQARRRGVRVEHLPDADPRRPGRAVRSQGRVRRPRHERELADRPAARLSCACRPAR